MEEKKERTIEKAREYFHKFWYRKASLSDLIAEIGISKPTFYNYFKNKEQLFASVMLATYNEFQYEFTQRSKTASSAVEKLEIFVRTYAWFLESFPLYKDLFIPGNDLLPRWIKSRSSKDLFAEGVETVKGIIAQGQEEGIFDPELDSEATSLIVYNTVVTLLSQDLKPYQRKNKPPYAINIDTLLRLLGMGLIIRD
ncbi:MAG: TetR/AcrR family transcriptional regulator [Spirochaetaceae bacterium]|nr:MAG: TetR/AcrR family transcriptional regulator [Spirochaetaceae bacterium]